MDDPNLGDLLSSVLERVEEVVWGEEFVELWFDEQFDGAYVFAHDTGAIFSRRGQSRNLILLIEQAAFCLCLDKDDTQILCERVKVLQEVYREKFPDGGTTVGGRFVRWYIPSRTTHVYLCTIVRDQAGEMRCPGKSFFRPGT